MKKSGEFKDIYNFMPRFVVGGEIESEDGGYLSSIVRRFEWNHTEFELVISPALITDQPGGDKYYFSGKKEQIVENALIELADPENCNFNANESTLVVRLNFLVEIVSDLSGDISLTAIDIDLALHVLADTKYELTRGISLLKFYPIGNLRRAEKDGEIYYCVKLTSISSETATIFDYLFGDKSLSDLREKFQFTS